MNSFCLYRLYDGTTTMHKDIVVSEMKVNAKLHLTEHNTLSLPSCMRGKGRFELVKRKSYAPATTALVPSKSWTLGDE